MPDTTLLNDETPQTVLVLDDEPIILMDLEFTLTDAGMIPLTANTAARALAIIRDQQPRLAILDVNLGQGETCAPVAALLEELKIPYLLHTGDLDRHGEGVTQFDAPILAKPSSSDEVLNMLRALEKAES